MEAREQAGIAESRWQEYDGRVDGKVDGKVDGRLGGGSGEGQIKCNAMQCKWGEL